MKQTTDKSLLLIEPDSSLGRGISHALRSMFTGIEHIKNPMKAVSVLETRKYDIIVTEFDFPTLDGLTLIPLLRRKAPGAVILVLAADINLDVSLVFDQNKTVVLEKPLHVNQLKKILEQYL